VEDPALVLRFVRLYSANFTDTVDDPWAFSHRYPRRFGKEATQQKTLTVLKRLSGPASDSIVFSTPTQAEQARNGNRWYGRAPVIVDGTHCPVAKFGDDFHRRRFWSHKFGAQGLTYQLTFGPFTNSIVQVSGPYPASVDDHSMWGFSGLAAVLAERDLYAIGDPGYRYSERVLSTIVDQRSRQVPFRCDSYRTHNTYISRVRWQVEAVFSRLKAFKAMSTPWRHALELHGPATYVCLSAINCDLVHHPVDRGNLSARHQPDPAMPTDGEVSESETEGDGQGREYDTDMLGYHTESMDGTDSSTASSEVSACP
jgi:hypothetical protein